MGRVGTDTGARGQNGWAGGCEDSQPKRGDGLGAADGNPAHLVDVLLLRLGHVSLALSLRLPSLTFDARAAVRCSPRVQAARALGPDFEAATGFALRLITDDRSLRDSTWQTTDESKTAAPARATLDIDGCVARLSRSSEASRARSAPRGARFPARHRPSAPSAPRDGPRHLRPRAPRQKRNPTVDRGGRCVRSARRRRGNAGARSAMGSTRGFAGGLKVYKPTSPGQRGRITTSRDHLWKGKPLKALTVGLRKKGGRNNAGRITVWHQGGGHKRLYRIIDTKRRATTAAGTVRRIEYDPNRTTRIALVDFLDDAKGTKPCYVLAPDRIKPGSTIVSSTDGGVDIRPGNAMPLREIPPGTQIHNIELRPGQGGVLVAPRGLRRRW